jgi:hypothetical protein
MDCHGIGLQFRQMQEISLLTAVSKPPVNVSRILPNASRDDSSQHAES